MTRNKDKIVLNVFLFNPHVVCILTKFNCRIESSSENKTIHL